MAAVFLEPETIFPCIFPIRMRFGENVILCWPLTTVPEGLVGKGKMHGVLVRFGKDSGHIIAQFERTGIRYFWRNDPYTGTVSVVR